MSCSPRALAVSAGGIVFVVVVIVIIIRVPLRQRDPGGAFRWGSSRGRLERLAVKICRVVPRSDGKGEGG